MRASRNAQLAQPIYDGAGTEAWREARLELLKPQQKQKQAKRRRENASYVLLAIVLFCSALAYTYMEARINIAGREVNDIQQQIAETEKLSLRTELEIGSLSALSRIENYAQLHLGMVYPDVQSVHYLSPQVSAQLDSQLRLLAAAAVDVDADAAESADTPAAVAEQEESYPLFVAWSQLIGSYFSGTALALE